MEVKVIMPNPKSNWESCVQKYWQKEKQKWEKRRNQRKK
ncbi:hypothetical protein SAMN04489735_1006121 [Aneurinibacillus thermoaerophilus]|uniref:Uncharacterized protein n=1 Tax=Aneurinibacillus thermoaerophilus TaxID=143495 RepID=A0A1G7YFD9_ANETH|nr:hypothetical protein SAMN04489735_1006121 [Aneurinibacillus thermoaerophilus]